MCTKSMLMQFRRDAVGAKDKWLLEWFEPQQSLLLGPDPWEGIM